MANRKHYYLFRYADNMWRCGEGYTVQEACQEAFGVIYGPGNRTKYKDMGTRTPKYLSEKAKRAFYSNDGWLDIPD